VPRGPPRRGRPSPPGVGERPRTWPKSSSSTREGEIAAQLTLTKGPSSAGSAGGCAATSSFRSRSRRTRTAASVGATAAMRPKRHHRRRAPDSSPSRGRPAARQLALERGPRQGVVDRRPQALSREGLLDEVEDAERRASTVSLMVAAPEITTVGGAAFCPSRRARSTPLSPAGARRRAAGRRAGPAPAREPRPRRGEGQDVQPKSRSSAARPARHAGRPPRGSAGTSSAGRSRGTRRAGRRGELKSPRGEEDLARDGEAKAIPRGSGRRHVRLEEPVAERLGDTGPSSGERRDCTSDSPGGRTDTSTFPAARRAPGRCCHRG